LVYWSKVELPNPTVWTAPAVSAEELAARGIAQSMIATHAQTPTNIFLSIPYYAPLVAGRSARDPWLCVPGSRRVCLYLRASNLLASRLQSACHDSCPSASACVGRIVETHERVPSLALVSFGTFRDAEAPGTLRASALTPPREPQPQAWRLTMPGYRARLNPSPTFSTTLLWLDATKSIVYRP
jgi:hypothetical protein